MKPLNQLRNPANTQDLRPSPIAGLWYSSSAKHLSQEIDDYLKNARLPQLEGEVIGVIAPHAGYRYSGATAGHAFRAVQGSQFDLVAVVSPLHAYHPAPLISSAHQAYSTPLGAIAIDHETLSQLAVGLREKYSIHIETVSNDREHSLEIELPFLQRALLGEFRLLPLMVRSHAPDFLEHLGAELGLLLAGRRALLVASTDLSHNYPEIVARDLDDEMLRQITAFSPNGVLEAERRGSGSACGAGAVAAVLWASQKLGAISVKLLHQSTSADETGDRSSVVGYGAAAILKQP